MKKLAEEHPAVKKPTEATRGEEYASPTVNSPAMKKPAAAGEEHPSPTVNVPDEETSDYWRGASRCEATNRGCWEEVSGGDPAGTEERLTSRIWPLESMSPSTITAQPPSFLTLEAVPCLGEKEPPQFHA
ncbi:hypothetical protein BHE74_00000524 [Ensete ventricosum]|nr:hypothetical protein GW17_00062085 [Ensete ventricosum]RWW90365.1 hypothetical protein BHE74_00000524 [Ensete ventricosum]RZR75745.1 hypothetical protein BHM03_00000225 [Ensete ventricosum]